MDKPTEFLERFVALRCEVDYCLNARFKTGLLAWQEIAWPILLLIGSALFFWPIGRSVCGSTYIPFIFKALAALLVTHPLLLSAHSRYFVQLIPLIALAIVYVDRKALLSGLVWDRSLGSTVLILGQGFALLFGALVIAIITGVFGLGPRL